MDQTLKAILRILEGGKPELKIAACQILGELRPGEAAAARALAERLSSQESFLTPFALDALAQLGSKEAVKVLVSKLEAGGAVGERVALLLGQMGPQVTKALAPMFDEADGELQARILAILGRHTDREALTILKKALLHADPLLSARAAEVIDGHLEALGDKGRDYLRHGLERSLSAKSAVQLNPASVAQALPVLGAIDGAGSRALLLKYASAKQAPVVRQAALHALRGVALTAAQRRTVLSYATEQDMTHVARPAMQLLEREHEWTGPAAETLLKLLESRNEERRLFALRALKNRHTEKMAKICIKLLLHGAPEFRAAAREALSGNGSALQGLLRSLQLEKNIDRARLLAAPLARLGKRLSAAQRKSLIEKTSKLLASREPMGEVYLSLLLDIDRKRGTKDLVDKAVRLRRARRLEDCITILMRLAQSEDLDSEGRYQLALARLMMDAKVASRAEERREGGDATMGYFAGLIRDGFPLFDRIKKEGQLTPDDLFRVGRHFATGVSKERKLGSDLLHLVAVKHSRRKVGEEAKLMLRSEGL